MTTSVYIPKSLLKKRKKESTESLDLYTSFPYYYLTVDRMLYDKYLTIEYLRLNYIAVKSYQDQSTSKIILKYKCPNVMVF